MVGEDISFVVLKTCAATLATLALIASSRAQKLVDPTISVWPPKSPPMFDEVVSELFETLKDVEHLRESLSPPDSETLDRLLACTAEQLSLYAEMMDDCRRHELQATAGYYDLVPNLAVPILRNMASKKRKAVALTRFSRLYWKKINAHDASRFNWLWFSRVWRISRPRPR